MSHANQLLDRGTLAPSKPLSLESLPNEHGFEFIGYCSDGRRVECRVAKGEDGLHRVEGEPYGNLVGWRYPATLDNLLRDKEANRDPS